MRMARPWSLVHTLEARPYSTPLAHSRAWASSSKLCTVMTGPNTSWRTSSSPWWRPATTVGAKQYPRSPTGAPPVSTRACAGHAAQEALDALEVGGAVERAVVGAVLPVRAHGGAAGLLDQGIEELGVDRAGRPGPGWRRCSPGQR